jgi:hypothetical protein
MEEGAPIAYTVLGTGVPVYCADGEQVGTVARVLAEPSEDIFHGVLVSGPDGIREVGAADVRALHENGVDLALNAAAFRALTDPRSSIDGDGASGWDELHGRYGSTGA